MPGARVRAARGRGLLTLLAIVGVAVASACENGATPPVDDGVTTISVTVRADGAGRQGVTVRLFASGSETALATKQTGTTGVALFEEIAAGDYEAEIDVPTGLALADGEVARKNVSVSEQETSSISFDLVSEGDTGGDAVEIHLTAGNQFSPSSVTISVGTTVRWISDTGTFHTITPDGHSEWARQEMNTSGQTFEVTFQNTGTFDYFCEPHESIGMTGSITVQ